VSNEKVATEKASGVKWQVMQALGIVDCPVELTPPSLSGEGEDNFWRTIVAMLAWIFLLTCFRLT